MNRMRILFGQRRFQVLATMAVLLLAVSVVMASGANFTSTSANPSNVFTAGTLSHSNSKADAAILTASLMKPGDTKSGQVIITNTGDVAGTFTLSRSNLTQTAGFADLLTVKIVETKTVAGVPVTSTVYDDVIGSMPAQGLGSFAAGESRTYDFTVTFPDGTPAHDNPYQGATMSIQYDWNAS